MDVRRSSIPMASAISRLLNGLRKPLALRTGPGISTISTNASAWLDALRVFLLAQVVLGHLAYIALPEIPHLTGRDGAFRIFVIVFRLTTRFGPQAACVFVVLSGFLVGGPLFAKAINGDRMAFNEFARRRLIRVAPALWIALGLSACLDLTATLGFGAAETYAHQRTYNFFAAMTLKNFLGNFLCLEPTFVSVFGSNGPLWTLGYIVQFYLAGFVLSNAIAVRARWSLAAATGGFLATALFRPEWTALFSIWCLGAVVRNVVFGEQLGGMKLAVGIAFFVAANRGPSLLSILVCGVGGAVILDWARTTAAAAPQGCFERVASISYEAYAVHFPIAFFISATLFRAPAHETATFVLFVASSLLAIWTLSVVVKRVAGRVSTCFERVAS